MINGRDAAARGRSVLDAGEVDRFLTELAAMASEFLADGAAAEVTADYWDERRERILERSEKERALYLDPREAVTCLRDDLTASAARAFRAATRQLVAWRADVAAYVVLATVEGLPVKRARLVAAAPCAWWSAEGATCLPAPSEHVRTLVKLAGRLAGGASLSGMACDDLLADAKDLAAFNGLVLRRGGDGELVATEDISEESHRRRLWGACWTAHQLPALPEVEYLDSALAGCGVPDTIIEDIRHAATAMVEVLQASIQLKELATTAEHLSDAEYYQREESLYQTCDQTVDRLVAYADTLTRHLHANPRRPPGTQPRRSGGPPTGGMRPDVTYRLFACHALVDPRVRRPPRHQIRRSYRCQAALAGSWS